MIDETFSSASRHKNESIIACNDTLDDFLLSFSEIVKTEGLLEYVFERVGHRGCLIYSCYVFIFRHISFSIWTSEIVFFLWHTKVFSDITIVFKVRKCRDKTSDNDVFFESFEFVDFHSDRRINKDTDCLLEGCC